MPRQFRRCGPLRHRFFAAIGKKTDSGCILWSGAKNKAGYGRIGLGGYAGKGVPATRVSYEEFIGPVAPGLYVLHHCDNPSCINPFHLFLGTQADNMADMRSKGRGHTTGNAKVTEEQVKEIRRLAALGFSSKQIAPQFGICDRNVRDIVAKRIWTRV